MISTIAPAEMSHQTTQREPSPLDDLGAVVSAADWVACQDAVREVHVDEKIRRYILEIVHGTRMHDDVLLGGSPRASIALFRTAQALAAVGGRGFAMPDDVKRMVQPVLAHRIILRPRPYRWIDH